ncbi:unnamed protein product, partial [Brassica rapa]
FCIGIPINDLIHYINFFTLSVRNTRQAVSWYVNQQDLIHSTKQSQRPKRVYNQVYLTFLHI